MFNDLTDYLDSIVARDPAPRSRWEVLLYPGVLAVGMRCDLALYRIERPAELCYWLGGNPCQGRVVAGIAA